MVLSSLMIGCLIVVAAGLQSYAPILKTLMIVLSGVAGLFLIGGSGLILYGDSLPKIPETQGLDQF